MSAWLSAAAAATVATALAVAPGPPLEFADDLTAPIVASVYSLPPALVDVDEARRFLAALRQLQPGRQMIVWSAGPLLAALAQSSDPRIQLLGGGGDFSLWPRDPFLFAHQRGGVVVVARPNTQRGRAADRGMGAALARDLPPALRRAWGGLAALDAPVPFHGGNLLLTPTEAWTTLHGLEIPILDRLGVTAVPVESFASQAGREGYLAAATAVAAELGVWLGRPVRFVHPTDNRLETWRAIGGGAGFDLDSVLTLLPNAGGKATALVGDLSAGSRLLERTPDGELGSFRATFELGPEPRSLRAALASYTGSPRAAGLAAFLDLCARHFAALGHPVERLPLLLVPATALADRSGAEVEDFLVTWNNVVVEGPRAVGFASGLATGDKAAIAVYAAHRVQLDLVPALRRSIVLGGGYRCASNHLRKAEPVPKGR